MLLVSVVLVLCMAFGMTACGDNRGNGGGEGNKPEPATPAITTDVSSLSLVKNEKVNVTATVSNSQKSASFSLAEGDEHVVSLTTSKATPNVATIEAIADGDATLTVALEGATSVTVPVTVDGILRIDGDILDQTKVFDAGETGTDDGETATFTVEHFMGDDCKLEVTSSNDAVAELSESNGTYSIKALQAGVSEITITLSAVKEETPDEGEGTPSEPDAQSDDVAVTPEYEEIYTNTLGFVCTDDWDKAAKADEISSKLLNFKKVTGGYAAYIDASDLDEDFINFDLGDFDGKLHVPAVYNRKPVVTLAPCQVRNFGQLDAYFLAFNTDITGEDLEVYNTIYATVTEVYLPCTLTEIATLAFRLAPVEKVEVQKGNHIAVIGVQAFNEASNLSSFNMEDCKELKTIKNNAFDHTFIIGDTELTIPKSVSKIESEAFANTNITVLNFEEDSQITDISYAFKSMAHLKEIDLSKLSNLTVIGTQAFMGTGDGTLNLFIPNTVTEVQAQAFFGINCNTIEFEAAKKVDGEYVSGITFKQGAANTASGIFGATTAKTIILRNIKDAKGKGDYLMQLAPSINRLVIGEDIAQSALNSQWLFVFAFASQAKTEIVFEGANNLVAQNIAASGSSDNCGGLLGDSSWIAPTFSSCIAPIKVYIHNDLVNADKVSGYIKGKYTQDASYEGKDDLADYTLWNLNA